MKDMGRDTGVCGNLRPPRGLVRLACGLIGTHDDMDSTTCCNCKQPAPRCLMPLVKAQTRIYFGTSTYYKLMICQINLVLPTTQNVCCSGWEWPLVLVFQPGKDFGTKGLKLQSRVLYSGCSFEPTQKIEKIEKSCLCSTTTPPPSSSSSSNSIT